MNRAELVRQLRRPGESVKLSFSDPMHTQWLYGIYGGKGTVQKRLPLLEAAWGTTVSELPRDELCSGGFVDDNGVNAVHSSSRIPGAITANTTQANCMNIQCCCLAKGTKISMVDGTTRSIEDLKMGDLVAGEDWQQVAVENIIIGVEHEPLVVLHTAAQTKLFCSVAHPIMTTKGMVKAGELTSDSKLYGKNGEELELDGIRKEDGEHTVYNILVPCGRFYAEGILVGDFTVQEELSPVKQTLWNTEENPIFAEYNPLTPPPA